MKRQRMISQVSFVFLWYDAAETRQETCSSVFIMTPAFESPVLEEMQTDFEGS